MTPSLDALLARGALSSLDVHFARAIGRRGGEARDEVLLAVALASRQVSVGHVCLELDRLADSELALEEEAGAGQERAEAPRWDWPSAQAWVQTLRASELVDGPEDGGEAAGSCAPLVIDAEGRLYLRRYWEHQTRLAQAIRGRLADAVPAGEIDEALLARSLDRLFPSGSTTDGSDRQRLAAERALRSRFLVVTGGPGTGKTSVVVKILVLLAEQALARGERAPRTMLTAPTGKAAARLQEAVARSLSALDCGDAVRDAIPRVATTIHRCLGALGGPGVRFRHDAESPLETDLVVIDEASMVDLALMSRLARATPARARLILLGDRDQLASVQAGSVLADIGAEELVPASADGRLGGVVELVHSHRFGAESGIAALCRAVNEGDADAALALLDDPARDDVSIEEPFSGSWRAEVREGYAPLFSQREPLDRLRALDGFRVLCAHRHGAAGVLATNRAIGRLLEEDGHLRVGRELQDGMPVLVTRNDYELGLYNGDVGLVVDSPSGESTRALFLGADGTPRFVSPLRLRGYETVFAMSIHKSQGSEFDHVSVLLPEEISPVLTRELVYTAVSRARRRVRLHAHREVLRAAIGRRVSRASGLGEAIWGEAHP